MTLDEFVMLPVPMWMVIFALAVAVYAAVRAEKL